MAEAHPAEEDLGAVHPAAPVPACPAPALAPVPVVAAAEPDVLKKQLIHVLFAGAGERSAR